MNRIHRLGMVAALYVLASCGDPVGSGEPGWLRASLSGAVSGSYQGTGDFLDQANREVGPRRMFSVVSTTAGPNPESFSFYRQNGNRPAVGTYQLELVDQSDFKAVGFFAFYTRATSDRVESFVAQSGEVVITRSTSNRVEGTFRFVGFRYCAIPRTGNGQEGPCSPPATALVGAPTVEVSGSFSVAPDDGDDMLPM
ncbi:MAG TPA: hypothetical protein VGB24_05660 [Longimicrobium sp.]|jgi:hypothetical protein|uniref:hypothetical protein n=1 Tax=Longimicrobium sp. TaxID=2029185 RepID=UPI002ED88D6D